MRKLLQRGRAARHLETSARGPRWGSEDDDFVGPPSRPSRIIVARAFLFVRLRASRRGGVPRRLRWILFNMRNSGGPLDRVVGFELRRPTRHR